jgi:hypothetical protein
MYVPYIPVPAQPIPSPLTGYTNGTIYTQDYALVLNAIAEQLNEVGYNFSGAASFDIGSASASLSAIAINSGSCSERLAEIDKTLQALAGSVLTIANKIEVSTKGLATISSHMAKSGVISQMQLADQITANEFNKQTANAAQVAAGLEPTVIAAPDFLEKAKSTIVSFGQLNAQVGATAVVVEATTAAASSAFTTATTWAAESALGTWVIDAYAKTEIAVVSIFSEKKAKQLELALRDRTARSKTAG